MTASFRLSCLAACCLLSLSQPAQAQLGRMRGQQGSLDNLKAALPFVNWNSRTHGPLIAITPEKVRWESMRMFRARGRDGCQSGGRPGGAPTALCTPDEKDTLDADVVARHFRRKLIRLPTLSIFAPPKMTVLINTNLQPAKPVFQGAQLWDNMKRLEATLTASQWQMLGSPAGLGSWGI